MAQHLNCHLQTTQMNILKQILNVFKKTFLAISIFLLLYIVAAFSLSKITVNSDSVLQAKEIPIYIMTNGVHTDIVVPIKNEIKDWNEQIKIENTIAKDTTARFLAFGWGDKGFYLDTPEWSDLKVSTAFNAASGIGNTAIHATFYKNPRENKDCIKVLISKENYKKLVAYIENSFQINDNKQPMLIQTTTYGKNDAFYEAMGSYSLFHTCNSWANCALKESNQKSAFWTVTDSGIFCHYL